MAIYNINRIAQANGDHEAHKSRCLHMPIEKNRLLLGDFYTCFDAVRAASKIYSNTNGCYYCSERCHTSYTNKTPK